MMEYMARVTITCIEEATVMTGTAKERAKEDQGKGGDDNGKGGGHNKDVDHGQEKGKGNNGGSRDGGNGARAATREKVGTKEKAVTMEMVAIRAVVATMEKVVLNKERADMDGSVLSVCHSDYLALVYEVRSNTKEITREEELMDLRAQRVRSAVKGGMTLEWRNGRQEIGLMLRPLPDSSPGSSYRILYHIPHELATSSMQALKLRIVLLVLGLLSAAPPSAAFQSPQKTLTEFARLSAVPFGADSTRALGALMSVLLIAGSLLFLLRKRTAAIVNKFIAWVNRTGAIMGLIDWHAVFLGSYCWLSPFGGLASVGDPVHHNYRPLIFSQVIFIALIAGVAHGEPPYSRARRTALIVDPQAQLPRVLPGATCKPATEHQHAGRARPHSPCPPAAGLSGNPLNYTLALAPFDTQTLKMFSAWETRNYTALNKLDDSRYSFKDGIRATQPRFFTSRSKPVLIPVHQDCAATAIQREAVDVSPDWNFDKLEGSQ
ncbi:hypothetical protein B0H11DRAFT_1909206 [Mycena galericulata]|nr:hypothetical protein B0H11DRAFT_1909206 [Mycena galericulata]